MIEKKHDFIVHEMRPYNFSYYTSRFEGTDEVVELMFGTPLITSPYCLELIFKNELNTIIFSKSIIIDMSLTSIGKINTYKNEEISKFDENNDKSEIEENEKVFDITCNNKDFKSTLNSFITNFCFSFAIFRKDEVFLSFSRIEKDINTMYVAFTVDIDGPKNKDEKDAESKFLKSVFLDPLELVKNYVFVENDFDEDSSTEKNKIDDSVEDTKILSEINSENEENNIQNFEQKEIGDKILDLESFDYKETLDNENQKNENSDNINKECTNQSEYEKDRKQDEQKSGKKNQENKYTADYKERAKLALKKFLEPLEDSDDIVSEKHLNIIKYGKLTGNAMSYKVEKLDTIISIKNQKRLLLVLSSSIIDMVVNEYDLVEIRSEPDIFIIKTKEMGIVLVLRDQIDSTKLQFIDTLTTSKEYIEYMLKDQF